MVILLPTMMDYAMRDKPSDHDMPVGKSGLDDELELTQANGPGYINLLTCWLRSE